MKKLIFAGLMIAASIASAGNGDVGSVEGSVIAVKATVHAMPFGDGTDFLLQNPQLISFTSNLDKKLVENFVSGGFSTYTREGSKVQAGNCTEALLLIKVGKGNILPNDNGEEIYAVPEIIQFTCMNK